MTLLAPHGSIEVALLVLVGLVLLKYAGLTAKIMKGIGFLIGAVFFLFLEAFTSIGFWTMPGLASAQYGLTLIWGVIAWIMFLVGTFMIASDLLTK